MVHSRQQQQHHNTPEDSLSEMDYHHREEEEEKEAAAAPSIGGDEDDDDDDYMDDILAPSFELAPTTTTTTALLNHSSHNNPDQHSDSMDSADSIIRRVEDEIANARVNARNAQQQKQQHQKNNNNKQNVSSPQPRVLSEDTDDLHIHNILNITMSSQEFADAEENHHHHEYPLKSSISSDVIEHDDDGDSSSSSHHNQVLDLIRDEFSPPEEKKTAEQHDNENEEKEQDKQQQQQVPKTNIEKQHLTDEEEDHPPPPNGTTSSTMYRQSPPATPNRNYRRSNSRNVPSPKNNNHHNNRTTISNRSSSPREPEGNYFQPSHNNNKSNAIEPPPASPSSSLQSPPTPPHTPRRNRHPHVRSSSSPTATMSPTSRTQELLDSLRQQRESIRPVSNNNNNPDAAARSSTSSSTVSNNNNMVENPENDKRSQPSYRFTRATHAKQRVKALSNHYQRRINNTPEFSSNSNIPATSTSNNGIATMKTTTDSAPETQEEEEPNSTTTTTTMQDGCTRTMPESSSSPASASTIMMMKKRSSPRKSPDRQVVLVEPTKPTTTRTPLIHDSFIPIENDTEPVSNTIMDKENKNNTLLDDFMQKIRFRNPFPVIKSPPPRRDAESIIADHTVTMPDIPIRWVKPKKELKQLIVAAMGTSLPRRSNACGALKVLTRVQRNQLTLARTDGFLSAIIFAASQSIVNDNNYSNNKHNNNQGDGDVDNIALAVDARTRAVACIINVCNPKDNRILVMSHPGLAECLVKVLEVDCGEARALAAGALALLAKTPACRETMAQVDGIIDTLAQVMHRAASMESEEAKIIKNAPSMRSATTVDDDEHEYDDHASQTSEHTNEEHPSDREDDDGSAHREISSHSSVENSPSSVNKSHKAELRTVDSLRARTEERQGEFVEQARSNACAALLHMSKQCAISPVLCANDTFLYSLVAVAKETNNPIHTKCLEIICNLTRFPSNNAILTRYNGLIETLLSSCNSSIPEGRLSALRSLQNMSADPASKALLASPPVLTLMTSCAMRKVPSEKEVAVAILCNITTEPSAVTAITNTKNVVATLVHLAHSPDSSSSVRLLACDGLATISLWLQTLAGTGKVPTGMPNVLLPSQHAAHWERWD